MELLVYQVKLYVTKHGHSPFSAWLEGMDVVIRAKIAARILRFEYGNFGDIKNLGEGLLEARFHLGPGYRIYFGISGRRLIVLLNGGSKSTQTRDIRRARLFWADWMENDS